MIEPPSIRVFGKFDFAALLHPSFKEDAVREELIAPMLRLLGYAPTGRVRVERSKALLHPFVMIGSKKHRVTIIPDYTLWLDVRPLLVLDAKAPTQALLKSKHAEQAYSYAMHPEVRCDHYALCNGHELVVFETAKLEPLRVLKMRDLTVDQAEKYLGPRYLEKPMLRAFDPDLGVHLCKLGCKTGSSVALSPVVVGTLARLSDQQYSTSVNMTVDGSDFCATFDFRAELLEAVLAPLPDDLRAGVKAALGRSPFQVSIDKFVKLEGVIRLGEFTPSEHEGFIPFVLESIAKAMFIDDAWVQVPRGLPAHVFSVARTLGHAAAQAP